MVWIPRKPRWLTSLFPGQVRRVQRQLNAFTNKHLDGVKPLRVDGKVGKLTRDRVVACKYWLGYTGSRNAQVKRRLMCQLAHPNWRIFFPKGWIALGNRRRATERAKIRHNHHLGVKVGTAVFDGVTVAAYFVPILEWCRKHGWTGHVVSGYRSPAYSEHLCMVMCGRPSCPGRCAGRSTNHAGLDPSKVPCGAVDVSSYVEFAQIVARCPLEPKLYNNLPIDPVHFSPRGN
jgi:hypothetical protein